MRLFYIFAIILTFLFSCSENKKSTLVKEAVSKPVNLSEEADRLSHEFIIVDGHIDLPYRLKSKMEDVSVRTQRGHFDYVRAKEGGLDAPFMSIYIPAEKEMNGAMDLALELIASVEQLCQAHPDKFAQAMSPADIEANFAKGLISGPMGLENGAPVEGKLTNLDVLYEKGIRYITLCHSKDNHICDSSYDQKYTHGGLSQFGIEVVRKMNELGIMVDVSHVSDSAFYQATRMINFGSSFITRKGNEAIQRIFNKVLNGEAEESDPEIQAALDSIKAQPELMGNISLVADHIDRVVEIAGIDHVGFGSDFDGVSYLPIGLEDASKFPDLIEELLKRGYTEEDIAKICYKNIFRVWNEAIAVSNGSSVNL